MCFVMHVVATLLLFFTTFEPVIQKSMSLKYEPSSEPLHIFEK